MSRQRTGGRLAVVLGITVLVGTACGAGHYDSTTTTTSLPPPPPPNPVPVAITVSGDTASVVAGEDQFGFDLLTSAGSPNANVVISPASVALALQMVAAGAKGRTATEMANVLHLPNAAGAATAARQVLDSLASDENDRQNTLRVANTVWSQQGMPVEQSYTSTLQSQFDTTPQSADFEHDPGQASAEIDKTVSDETNGMIPQLFPPGTLDSSTRLVLTNAIYLAASWATAFNPALTRPGPFTKADGTVGQVPMMNMGDSGADQQATFGYAQETGYQVVTLPYVGGKLAFTVLLPSGTSLAPLLSTLRAGGLPAALQAVVPTPLEVSLPKFTVSSSLDLKGALAGLGMPTAFTGAADFSGITTAQRLNIQTVRHDAVVKVDEHGTTAAAATGVGMQAMAVAARTVVVVNRPFLFVITDTATGAPLFQGQVTDPA